MKVTILGCGPTHGVPSLCYGWGECDPNNSKNKRYRASALVETQDAAFLIDSSPDVREQLLANNLKKVDAVLYTHAHADHAHGINDLKFLSVLMHKPIPIYGSLATIQELLKRFSYIFFDEFGSVEHHKPFLTPYVMQKPFSIKNVEIIPFEQEHGGPNKTTGYRIGNFAYSTDVVAFKETAFEALKDLDVWVVDCLRYEPALTHAHLDLTLSWIERVKPKRAILTHMNHDMDYDTLKSQLPEGVEPAYDGMVIEF